MPETLTRPAEIVPNPDPSVMTTALVDRRITDLKENIAARLEAVAVRLDAMQLATSVLHEDMVRVPTLLDRETRSAREFLEAKLQNIADVTGERFARVDTLFSEGDKRAGALRVADALALAAALQAAKEAVGEQNRSNTTAIGKSENATGESIKQMRETNEAANRATNEKIDDLKSRLDRGEGGTAGAQHVATERRLDLGTIMGALALAAVVVFGLLSHLVK